MKPVSSCLKQFERKKDPSFRFDADGHTYWLNDQQMPGLTTCLRQAGLVDTRFLKETGRRRGSVVHAALHFLDEHDLDWATLSEEALAFVRGYEKFKKEWNFNAEIIERPMYHRLLKYGFTLDREGWILKKKQRVIVEIKTGQMKEWTAIQTMGQALGLQSWEDKPISRRRFGVNLPGNGDYRIKEYTDKNEVRVFMSTLNITNWMWVPKPLTVPVVVTPQVVDLAVIKQEANNAGL